MNPIINLDDPVGKTVGRRRPPDPLKVSPSEKRAKEQWREAGLSMRIKKGVYRFNSHLEANEWLMKQMTRRRAN